MTGRTEPVLGEREAEIERRCQMVDLLALGHTPQVLIKEDIPYLLARVATLTDALRKHGEHMSGCAFWDAPEGVSGCTCGLDVALSSLPEGKDG